MGTWDSSKIRVSRRERPCDQSRTTNRHNIAAGERYLDYMIGQRHHVPVCLNCALTLNLLESELLKYDCAAVQAELSRSPSEARPSEVSDGQ